MDVSGSDVYLAGYKSNGTKNVATYWKNGQEVALTDGTNTAFLSDICIVGNDVYAVGYEYNTDNRSVAKLWKNGIVTNLSDGTNSNITSKIIVVNNEVYIAGYEQFSTYSVATFWKNGVAKKVGDPSTSSLGVGIFVNQ